MDSASESRFGWLTSIAFWVCLLIAATLYALAALSPACLANLQLTQRYHGTQLRLVGLESDDLRLQRIVQALKTNPRYAQELAQHDFQGVASATTDEQRLPLEGDLALDLYSRGSQVAIADPDLPWFASLLVILVEDRSVSTTLLILAAVIVIYAFGFLQTGRSA